jgi:hypothetical protein
MYAGTGKDDSERENLGTFEYNLIYDHDNNNCIELKSSRNTVRFNTLIGVRRTANINVRHGYDNRIIANHVERGGIVVRDYRTYVAGNRLVNSRDGLVVYAGNITPEQLRDHTSGYPNAIDTRLIKNTSDQTTIGGTNGWVAIHKAKRTALEAHVGPYTQPAAEGTTSSPTTAEQVPATVRLTEGDVGPNAP